MAQTQRLVVRISGAIGIIYGIRLLQMLRETDIESHLVVSKAAELTRGYETNMTADDLKSLADFTYLLNDVGAAIASGSFKTMGMIVAPCSIKTLSEIAHGTTSTLLTRAADVVLKEQRRLVLMVREAPLHTGHLKSMLLAAESGAIISPPVPAFYNCPTTLDDLVNHTVGRVLDLFGIEVGCVKRWGESSVLQQSNQMMSRDLHHNGSIEELTGLH